MIFLIFWQHSSGLKFQVAPTGLVCPATGSAHHAIKKRFVVIFFSQIFFSPFLAPLKPRFFSPKLRNFCGSIIWFLFEKQEAKRNETSDLRMLYNVYQMAGSNFPPKVPPRPPKTNITMGKPSIWRCISYGTWQFFQCHASVFFRVYQLRCRWWGGPWASHSTSQLPRVMRDILSQDDEKTIVGRVGVVATPSISWYIEVVDTIETCWNSVSLFGNGFVLKRCVLFGLYSFADGAWILGEV